MQPNNDENDVYIIPPNFIDTGTVLGGSVKLRNAMEALGLVLMIGFPVFHLPFSLTTRIIIACITVLPAALFAIIGIGGESLTEFLFHFIIFLKKKRIVGAGEPTKEKDISDSRPKKRSKPKKEKFAEEFGKEEKHSPKKRENARSAATDKQTEYHYLNPVADYLPIEKIENGIIYTKDHRYVKLIEVEPINFLLRSSREQRNIIYSFVCFLKISPVKLQFKVLTKKADINKHLAAIEDDISKETDERCIALQKDYKNLIKRISSKDAITRRFFIAFEYEPQAGTGRKDMEAEAISALTTVARTAKNYLKQCGNDVITPEDDNELATDVLYNLLNRKTSNRIPLSTRINEVIGQYITNGRADDIDHIPAMEFASPASIDFTHSGYLFMDGIYHAYLLIPSFGYRAQVCAGWISLLVNAGEGIDVDLFFDRQPKDKIQQKLGQQLRINRSKIKDTSDTNSDFDDLDSAIRSGYFLKEGLANEDFYYLNILITITGESVEELEWRIAEMKKLLLSQDMDVLTCSFRQEQAFLSSLPIVHLEKSLFEKSKRNVLTSGIASCYPFTSYEMCDDNGILLGVNKHNNSLIIVDIFNSRIYKNANMAILGTSGAGKTFTLQLMALRMRRKNIQVFIIAPLKGHEFRRACNNIGGEFIQISPASKNCINIMEIRKIDSSANDLIDGSSQDKSLLAAKIQKLHIFFSLLIPDMSHEERQLLDESLIQTYNKKGITHNNDSLCDPKDPSHYKEMPVLEDVYNILIENADTRRLANIMNRLVHGSASTFNQQTNVSLENKYTVLDISELTGDLLTVGMFVALDYVWDKAKEDRTAEKAIFIDEVWQLIGSASNHLAAEFVVEIFKIIRGYGGSAICATQDLNDFFSMEDGKYGKGIINNSKTKIILNQEDEEAIRVQNILHLSEAETMAITHFERGNGLISTNNNNVTVEFKASELEKELITTDREELKRLLEREKQRHHLPDAG